MATQKLSISNFGKAGLNSDILPWDLPPEYLTSIRNVRIVFGRFMNYRGSGEFTKLPEYFSPGYISYVNSTTGDFWVVCGVDNSPTFGLTKAVYVYDGTNWTDISLSGAYGNVINPVEWQGCMLSSIPIINHPGTSPQYWAPQAISNPVKYLPWIIDPVVPANDKDWATANQKAKIIRSHKQYLFALNLYDNGTHIPDGVRWSSPADINGLPQTWDPLDFTNVAGFTTLGADGGEIIDGLSLRDAFVVYRENSISVFDYIGGQYLWQIRTHTSTFGLISKDCIVEVAGIHYFIGQEDIYTYDGNSLVPMLHNILITRFTQLFDKSKASNAYAVVYDTLDEIWFCIPTYGTNDYASIAFVHNWRDKSWTIIDLPNGISRDLDYGPVSFTAQTWENRPNQWSQSNDRWSTSSSTVVRQTLVGIQGPGEYGVSDNIGRLIVIDPSFSTQVFTDFPSTPNIVREGFPIGDLGAVTTITRVYPKMQGDAKVWISIGAQDYPGSPIRWKPAVLFDSNFDRKIDVRSTGELHCFKVESFDNTNEQTWELSGWDVEYVYAGAR